MHELINVNIRNEDGKLLVSSRDIAKGLEKEHYDVLKKVREVLGDGEFSCSSYLTEQGKEMTEYLLDKNAFILLVMNYTGYNDFKRAYIKRFDEMEKQLSFNVPKTFPEALRCLAAEVEQKELMQKQRDEAIRTKAWISDKKTATAMNTASQKSKEVEKLKIELDRSKKFASIKAVEMSLKQKFDWKPLRNYCTAHELEMPKIFDANYGKVRTYPAKAWAAIYEVDLEKLF